MVPPTTRKRNSASEGPPSLSHEEGTADTLEPAHPNCIPATRADCATLRLAPLPRRCRSFDGAAAWTKAPNARLSTVTSRATLSNIRANTYITCIRIAL